MADDALLVDNDGEGESLCANPRHEKPDLRYAKTESDVNALAGLQKKILETCSRYVRPGGILLYATCTISKKENEVYRVKMLNLV